MSGAKAKDQNQTFSEKVDHAKAEKKGSTCLSQDDYQKSFRLTTLIPFPRVAYSANLGPDTSMSKVPENDFQNWKYITHHKHEDQEECL